MHKTPQVGTQITEIEEKAGDDISDRGKNVFGTEKVITEYFPGSEFRKGQKDAVEAVEDAFSRGYKYVILEAPTGTGKSFIGATFANASKSTHMLTIQKILQDQYKKDFPDFYVIKGRGAYECLKEEGVSCAKGPCQRSKKVSCEDCLYKIAKYEALAAKVTIHNFDSFYYQNQLGMGYPSRQLMIIDEAHNIEHKYLGFMSFTISSKNDVTGIPIPECQTLAEYREFIAKYSTAVNSHLDFLEDLYDNGILPKDKVGEMRDLRMLSKKMVMFMHNSETSEYVFDYSDNSMVVKVTFRPIMVDYIIPQSLFGYADKFLMMSATILDKTLFCEGIGLDPEEVCMLTMDSLFPKKNRPIIKRYVGYMSYKHINKTLPLMMFEIETILEKHSTRKGIIQTHTERIANYIRDNISADYADRMTYNKDFNSPQEMLEVHKDKPASIIVASGLREGLDLKGSLSNIQIICKVPYPSLADKQVARRAEISSEWYGYITTLMFLQSLGRSVRSETDKAFTYILDQSFVNFLNRNKNFIPDYILEAIL